MPTLIVHTRHDRTVPDRYAKATQAGIARSHLVTFEGGHVFFFFRTRQFVDTINEFLRTLRADASG
ncbi:MAG TPA: alpha/beta hydrolase [Ktedonobacterales bacterium]|nr:alpha/beta hydrolase [Ktedonobacterales bacterium]